jgi:outer membrane lipoprotein LolB
VQVPRGSLVAAAALSVALLGCGSLRERSEAGVTFPPVKATYDLTGRLSARHAAEGLSASYRWHHDRDSDELELASPLGQTLAQLSGGPAGVTLRTADGRIETASDWQTLTSRGLGWPLPVTGLSYWVQGVPREGAPFVVEPGDAGAPGLLRQDGWTVVYNAFAADRDGVLRPSRMTLSYADVEVRLVIDEWQ